jgi:predicted enzyme related to lactoylglutathione lyase
MAHGHYIWHELVTPSPAAARGFYEALFAWQGREQDMGMPSPYTVFRHEGLERDVAGSMAAPMPEVPPHWLAYLQVDDLDGALERARAREATMLAEPFEVPGVGRMAVIRDPQGAVVALMTAEADHPVEARPPVGSFCWTGLMTDDVDAAAAFYADVAGLQVGPMGDGKVLTRDGAPCASVSASPPGAPTHWLAYVAVDDADDRARAAVELGATQHVPPTDMPGMGRFAVLADPAGAVFAVWKDLGGQEV